MTEQHSLSPVEIKPHPSTKIAVVLAWVFVGVPAGWGIFNTVRQATQLFK